MKKILDWIGKIIPTLILIIAGLPAMLLIGVVALFLIIYNLIEQIWNRK